MDLGLRGKTAIVTGGASGMGKVVAKLLASEGVAVWLADINGEGARATAAEITDAGGKAEAATLDVASREQWQALVEKPLANGGKLDILCNIAGPGAKTGHLNTDDA